MCLNRKMRQKDYIPSGWYMLPHFFTLCFNIGKWQFENQKMRKLE